MPAPIFLEHAVTVQYAAAPLLGPCSLRRVRFRLQTKPDLQNLFLCFAQGLLCLADAAEVSNAKTQADGQHEHQHGKPGSEATQQARRAARTLAEPLAQGLRGGLQRPRPDLAL